MAASPRAAYTALVPAGAWAQSSDQGWQSASAFSFASTPAHRAQAPGGPGLAQVSAFFDDSPGRYDLAESLIFLRYRNPRTCGFFRIGVLQRRAEAPGAAASP